MRNVPSLETVERDFAPKGVKFFYIYKSLAHPETNGYIAPFSLSERLMHIGEAKRTLGSRIPWLCDTMGNDLKHALGDAPNSEFVIDPAGQFVRVRQWSSPMELRRDLEELVGRVEKPTTVGELGMKKQPPPEKANTGIVPRIKLPGRMTPVKVTPLLGEGKTPFYVKLRAEAEDSLLNAGKGKMYLGFLPDPLYKVHWNNQAAAIEFQLEAPEGLTISPSTGKGPKVNEPADADPREFLVEVSGKTNEPIKLSVAYVACDDAETFCEALTQHYEIRLERDRDGGTRRQAGPAGESGFVGKKMLEGGIAAKKGAVTVARLLERMDADGDGQVALEEFPARMRERFDSLDRNGDGRLDAQELETMAELMRQGRLGKAKAGAKGK